ncbi:aminotransferase class III-fold pyridoxal phosphate-dependent enzyme [Aeromicrobium chenweiae]|uniref:Aspartate aminotransferase family protein n=1 Tax=Aeromicrobium chenweiae TaxID=2079793 RepID=A0A2S0WJS8_9ACTN|nr:aminotransferase class III-fold pyridoxal phosphate-dependent enzyme [Aeromicrobium chenweiae]AWB91542.1 aspartate aminotransferase family protein [Aeromicrobium chenweiae]TGN32377.1 aminotransferase class III-fold pyridoxal phosphate-dependent enzyme [Aeromicrobium chenweiae]
MNVTRSEHDRLQQSAKDHLVLHFSKQEIDDLLVLDRGEGPYVFDTTGRRYIDALSSLFCSQLGYSYGEEMADAARRQLTSLAFNTSWGTSHPAAIDLAERISDLAPADDYRVFFTGGGSESVEAAWKMVREHFIAVGQPQRTKAVARERAYHGVTLGALSFTGVQPFKEGFGAPPVEVARVSNTNAFRAPDAQDEDAFCRRLLQEVEDAVVAAGADEVALIIAEPVQNAGGCFTPPAGYWAGLRRIADTYGALLMADEVITGFGRIGEWFAVSREDVAPDLVTVAKGLTSAYAPMGATLVRERVIAPLVEQRKVFRHGITFGGHPLSAALAMKSIEIIERDRVLENVRAQADPLRERLHHLLELPIVGDVRGAGFFWAMELVKDDSATRFDQAERDDLLRGFLPARLREAGLIARCDDRGDAVLQIAPPLISDAALLDDIAAGLTDVLRDAGKHMGVG